MGRAKILLRLTKRAAKQAAKGQLRYKGKGVAALTYTAAKYGKKHGPKALLQRTKETLVRLDKRIGSNLHFPNGLVSGVDQEAMLRWYADHAMPVTVVIPSYNDLNVLVPCLESIAATSSPELVKVIVVDDYCQPEHQKKMKDLENEQVTVILRKQNGGFAKAVNTGLMAADKDHDVVLINSDIVAHQGWIEALQYGAYEFGVDTGIVGPKLLYPDGRIQSAGSHRNTDVPEFFDHYYRFQDANYGPANIPQYVTATTGACMYVKREFLQYVGNLDDNFQFAFEDVDWCLRGWEAGYRTLYFPAATLTHVESATRKKNTTISEKEKQSVKYFWEKWGAWFDERNVKNEDGQVRVIFVLQTFGLSGGIKNIFELANRLFDRGLAVEIWGLDKNPSPWETRPGLKIRTFKNYDRLTAQLSKEEAIKVATWWETAFPVWLSSVTKGLPVYYISEFETWFYPNDVVAQSAVVSCYRKEFKNITISSYNLDELRAIGIDAALIPCGYDDKTYRPLPEVSRKNDEILAVGRTFFQKNFDFTFRAWQALGEKRPSMKLFGFEPEMAKLDKRIAYKVKPTNEEVNRLYNETAFFVQTSRHEGFCLPLLEAMATGAPVICTDAHGNRDFCFDNKNCLMVEQDDVEGLREAMQRMLEDKDLRKRLSKESIKTAKQFQWAKITDKAERFFMQVAGKK